MRIHGIDFYIYGYPVIVGPSTYAYAVDKDKSVYKLIWSTAYPENGTAVVVIHNNRINANKPTHTI